MLALFIAALAAGIGSLVALLAPYSAYGRIAQNLLAPLWGWGNNLLAYFAERIDSYAFYRTDVWVRSAATFAVAAATFALIAVLAWRNGRTWCNTVCPVGTVLGFLCALLAARPAIDTEKCVGCNRCARNCKASCIDVEHHRIDYSRCVVCMDCIDTCHKTPSPTNCGRNPQAGEGREERVGKRGEPRRSFAPQFSVAYGHIRRTHGTPCTGEAHRRRAGRHRTEKNSPPCDADRPSRRPRACATWRTTAPAASSAWPSVPTGVLRPSEKLTSLMQPEMSYERGYCRPECTKCSRGLPRRSDPPRDGGREVVRADRPMPSGYVPTACP